MSVLSFSVLRFSVLCFSVLRFSVLLFTPTLILPIWRLEGVEKAPILETGGAMAGDYKMEYVTKFDVEFHRR